MCSKEQGFYQSNSKYWHIDNGGICLNVTIDEDYGYPVIEFKTEYFGYPAVSAILSGHISPEVLKEMGQELIRFSKDLKTYLSDLGENE